MRPRREAARGRPRAPPAPAQPRVAPPRAVTPTEIRRLWALFYNLDVDGVGSISRTELMELPQLKYNPLAGRMLKISSIKTAPGKRYTFRDFVVLLAVFAPEATYVAKLRFAFKTYDFDNDGKLGRDDLSQLIALLVPDLKRGDAAVEGAGETADDSLLHFATERCIAEADLDGDGMLNFGEFSEAVAHSDIASKLSIFF